MLTLSEAGSSCLFFALFASLISVCWSRYKLFTGVALGGVVLAYALLIGSYVKNSFEILNSYQNSHPSEPLFYKIVGAWGNHEGSMLLWVLLLHFYSFLFALRTQDAGLARSTNRFQFLISAPFLLYVIFAANPFALNTQLTQTGLGFNPLLQDPALAFHPPLLYFGYTALSVLFSLSLVALYTGQNTLEQMKPWLRLAWSLITIGVGLGSWWAYRELGWGGFWFWDPVENSSLLVWLLLTSVLHLMPLAKKFNLVQAPVIVIMSAFLVTVIGTWLIRSGIIVSIHSFAQGANKSLLLLSLFFVSLSGIGLLKFNLQDKSSVHFYPKLGLKDSFLILSQLILISAAVLIVVSLIIPILWYNFFGDEISISPQYFNSAFYLLAVPLLILLGATPTALKSKSSIFPVLAALFLAWGTGFSFNNLLVYWALTSNLHHYVKQKRSMKLVFAHSGIIIMIGGVLHFATFTQENFNYMQVGDEMNLNRYRIELTSTEAKVEQNHQALVANFSIYDRQELLGLAHPEIRFYPIANSIKAKTARIRRGSADIYLAIGEIKEGKLAVRIYYNPGMFFIWLGIIIMSSYYLAFVVELRIKRWLAAAKESKGLKEPM